MNVSSIFPLEDPWAIVCGADGHEVPVVLILRRVLLVLVVSHNGGHNFEPSVGPLVSEEGQAAVGKIGLHLERS